MKYVVLGASAAGVNGAIRLRACDPEAEITLISKDTAIYSRCIMHHYMEGIRNLAQLNFVPNDFATRYQINWLSGTAATKVNPETKEVHISTGESIAYDKLLIATGSHVFFPPIPGLKDAPNAIGFHDLEECEALLAKSKTAKNIVVLGAGLVGIDAVCGLLHTDAKLSMVEQRSHMLALQLDKRAAKTYEKAFLHKGVVQYYNVAVASLTQNEQGEITALTLSDGTTLDCDLLVVAAGIRANVDFLQGSGLQIDQFGLVIDPLGQTNLIDIYGAGDVSGRMPIWPVAVKEGIIAASNMAGDPKVMDDFFASKATMNFLGVPTLSLGMADVVDATNYQIEIEEDDAGNYKKIIHKDGKIYGAILQGDLSYAGVLTQLIRNQINVSKVKKPLFKIDYSDFFTIDQNLEFSYGGEKHA